MQFGEHGEENSGTDGGRREGHKLGMREEAVIKGSAQMRLEEKGKRRAGATKIKRRNWTAQRGNGGKARSRIPRWGSARARGSHSRTGVE